MTRDEFEDAYREALFCLNDAGHSTGSPRVVNGKRYCLIDDRPLNDYEVLELWWGKDIAKQIRQEMKAAPPLKNTRLGGGAK